MDFEVVGLLRSMWVDILALSSLIALTTLALVACRLFCPEKMEVDGESINIRQKTMSVLWRAWTFSVLLAIVALGLRALTISAVNRVPRADTDRSSVQGQIDSNIKIANEGK